MTMLSRVAERTYWLGRYIERGESLARLYQVYGRLFLDLPARTGVGWREILNITGSEPAFDATGLEPSEENVTRFLLSSEANPDSLLACLSMARENARTTRDILPTEAWLILNRLFVNLRERLAIVQSESARHAALTDVVSCCQTLTGVLTDNMSHGDAYQFVRAGRNLERIDMTSRTLDAAVALLMSGREELAPLDNTLWAAVLRSVSGYQMYRQHVRRRVIGDAVVRYLTLDEALPRSMRFCLNTLDSTFAGLPRGERVASALEPLRARLDGLTPAVLDAADVRALMDALQLDVAGAHSAIAACWFQPGDYS